LSISAPSNHTQFSAAFTTNIAESNFRYTQVALAWLLGKPGVTAPIIGAMKMQHLDDAIKALEISLDAETMKYLEEPYRVKPVAGHE
jgi:aryl-alcohol dehydrogenase-like predicted oxidoreductase